MNHLSLALRRSALLSMTIVAAIVLAACGAGGPAPADGAAGNGADGGGSVSVTDGVAPVTADNMAFDVDTIEAPAGEDFVIRLTNNENVPHNLSVYTREGGDLIAQGTIINEGETDEIEVSALEAGEYFFVCDLHAAEMRGTLVVEG